MRRVLIANRGEIAIRIARACRSLDLIPIAVASDADRIAPHVQAAAQVVAIGPAPARESYLSIDAILAAARRAGADAVHPGYGFLSENADFAAAVESAGLTWIGPPPAAIRTMGDKIAARRAVETVGVPVVPGATLATPALDDVRRAARAVGYPLLLKAAAGGGGKGMRTVATERDLPDAIAAAEREALGAFGDGRIYLERLLVRPRHVEIQVLADGHGALVQLGERECSIQRRHQKIIEESPCPIMTDDLRRRMADAALAAARAVDYVSAGTVEFLLDGEGHFYFLEMNTRLQVEHPVTELVTGIDLVTAQLRVAQGARLEFAQDTVRPRGHAIEARVYAEDPAHAFLPSAGPILALREPAGPGVRVDSGIAPGFVVPLDYDPMLAKIIAWGGTRAEALARLRGALADTVVLGPTTNLSLLRAVLDHPAFVGGATHTGFLDQHLAASLAPADGLNDALVAAAVAEQARADHVAPAAPGQLPTAWARLGAWRLRT